MRFEMIQCDALLAGCEGQIERDNAEGWLTDTGWTDGVNTYEDVCPRCADAIALEDEFEEAA